MGWVQLARSKWAWILASLPVLLTAGIFLTLIGAIGNALGSGSRSATLLNISNTQTIDQTCQLSTDPMPVAGAKGAKTPHSWNADQKANAALIVAQVKVDVPAQLQMQASIVALVTAAQESTLVNLPGGDRDSVGLFQQRDAWGPFSVRMNPRQSAHMFLTGGQGGQPGLLHFDGKNGHAGPWQSMPVTVAAQTVQVSAFPTAYAKWELDARALAANLLGALPVGDPCGGAGGAPAANVPADVAKMLAYAKSILGTPYRYGGTVPPPEGSGVDCSGLVLWAWGKAGHPMRIRTSEQMYSDSTPVPFGQERAGDLIFSEFGADASVGYGSGPGHVMIVLDPSQHLLIEAPHTGDVVKIMHYSNQAGQTFGRLTAAAFQHQGGA